MRRAARHRRSRSGRRAPAESCRRRPRRLRNAHSPRRTRRGTRPSGTLARDAWYSTWISCGVLSWTWYESLPIHRQSLPTDDLELGPVAALDGVADGRAVLHEQRGVVDGRAVVGQIVRERLRVAMAL